MLIPGSDRVTVCASCLCARRACSAHQQAQTSILLSRFRSDVPMEDTMLLLRLSSPSQFKSHEKRSSTSRVMTYSPFAVVIVSRLSSFVKGDVSWTAEEISKRGGVCPIQLCFCSSPVPLILNLDQIPGRDARQKSKFYIFFSFSTVTVSETTQRV